MRLVALDFHASIWEDDGDPDGPEYIGEFLHVEHVLDGAWSYDVEAFTEDLCGALRNAASPLHRCGTVIPREAPDPHTQSYSLVVCDRRVLHTT